MREIRPLGILLSCLFVFVSFLFSGGVILLIGEVDSSMLSKSLWLVIYICTAGLLFLYSRTFLLQVQRAPGFLLLGCLCVISVAWSSDVPTTVSYSVAIFGTTLFAYLIANRMPAAQAVKLITAALLLLVGINFFLMLPNISGYLSPALRYQGIFTQPNVLGRVAGLGFILAVMLMLSNRSSKVWALPMVGMAAVLLVACNSMTSILAVTFALSIFFLYKLVGHPVGSGQVALGVWFALCIGGILYLYQDALIQLIFGLLGRSTDLTGRVDLWDGLWAAVFKKPFLGYGYSGFWGGEPILAAGVLDNAGWTTESAHNGLMEIALHLGLLGVVVFCVTVVSMLIRGSQIAFGQRNDLALILLCSSVYILALGMTESTYMVRNSIFWILLTYSSVMFAELSHANSEES
ncbi:MAG: O-antigen ligase family protein [Opitutaceae bacterium]